MAQCTCRDAHATESWRLIALEFMVTPTGDFLKGIHKALSMKTELPPDVFFRPDLRLMIFRPRGVLDEKAVDQVVTFLEKEEEQADQCFNRFVDLSKLDSIQLSFDYLVRVSLHRRLSSMKRAPVKSAFFVTSEQAEHVADTHELGACGKNHFSTYRDVVLKLHRNASPDGIN